jgi:integrase
MNAAMSLVITHSNNRSAPGGAKPSRSINSRSSRRNIPRGELVWKPVRRSVHLGYRRPTEGAGSWLGRFYSAEHGYTQVRLAAADDLHTADGRDVLNFAQAMRRANDFAIAAFDPTEKPETKYTVRQACAAYLAHLEAEGRSAQAVHDAKLRINALILPKLGASECHELTAKELREWRNDLAKPNTRQRRATANRIWTVLRATLNLAYQNEQVASDHAWRKVKPFPKTDAPRQRWLTVNEAKKLLAACSGDFRKLVEAALHTGCRYGELIALRVEDFSHNNGSLHIRESKSGKPRDVILTEAGTAFFQGLCEDRDRGELILRNGKRAWSKSEQARPMAAAVEKAKLPAITFHGLRHTWASLAVMNGTPLLVVAKNLGHSGTRMVEKHYGHLAHDYVAEAIRKGAPQF